MNDCSCEYDNSNLCTWTTNADYNLASTVGNWYISELNGDMEGILKIQCSYCNNYCFDGDNSHVFNLAQWLG